MGVYRLCLYGLLLAGSIGFTALIVYLIIELHNAAGLAAQSVRAGEHFTANPEEHKDWDHHENLTDFEFFEVNIDDSRCVRQYCQCDRHNGVFLQVQLLMNITLVILGCMYTLYILTRIYSEINNIYSQQRVESLEQSVKGRLVETVNIHNNKLRTLKGQYQLELRKEKKSNDEDKQRLRETYESDIFQLEWRVRGLRRDLEDTEHKLRECETVNVDLLRKIEQLQAERDALQEQLSELAEARQNEEKSSGWWAKMLKEQWKRT